MDLSGSDDEGYDIPHPLWKLENREKTFENWNNNFVNIKSLAFAGFIYVGPGDRVKCVFCYLLIDEWVSGDDPVKKHKQLKPDCTHIESLQTEKLDPQQEKYNKFSVIVPNNITSAYQYEVQRIKTFEDWPDDHPISKDDLVNAGFFYTKVRDKVTCFACDLNVEQWDPHDDVYVEHCRFSPNCPFMMLKKGDKFIMQCNPGANASELPVEPSNSVTNVSKEVMNETLILQGFSKIYIDCALFQQLLKKEKSFVSSEGLFEAILKIPRAEEAASKRLENPEKTNDAEIALMMTCKVCLQMKCKYICIPCRHFTCCQKCKENFKDCPSCENSITFETIDHDSILQEFSHLTL